MNNSSDLTTQHIDTIIDGLVEHGLVVIPNFLDLQLATDLYDHIHELVSASKLQQASIGRQQNNQLNQAIRSDKTHWLDGETQCQRDYLSLMDSYQKQLNRHLYLGLNDYESHFAHYAAGDFYKRHLDAFKGKSNRVVTTVLYLNPDWLEEDGGELIIYKPDTDNDVHTHVVPHFGTLVLFMSERFPHEVLPAKRDRYSISGWFRIDSAAL